MPRDDSSASAPPMRRLGASPSLLVRPRKPADARARKHKRKLRRIASSYEKLRAIRRLYRIRTAITGGGTNSLCAADADFENELTSIEMDLKAVRKNVMQKEEKNKLESLNLDDIPLPTSPYPVSEAPQMRFDSNDELWNVLFGKGTLNNTLAVNESSAGSLKELIDIRRGWDCYVVSAGQPFIGMPDLPCNFVLPPVDPSEQWKPFQVNPEISS